MVAVAVVVDVAFVWCFRGDGGVGAVVAVAVGKAAFLNLAVGAVIDWLVGRSIRWSDGR